MQTPVLTAQERHQLLAVLRELDAPAPLENRRHPRRNVQLNLAIQLHGTHSGASIPAKLVNVSARGLGLELPTSLRLGRRFIVHLRFTEGGGWLVLCAVRNCTPLHKCAGGFRVGAEFIDQIEDPTGSTQPPKRW